MTSPTSGTYVLPPSRGDCPTGKVQILRERILERVDIVDTGHETPCWISNRATKANGYTVMSRGRGETIGYVHRLAYEAFVGPIPDGLQIDHLCRQRACCNPDHLEAVTCRVNLLRGETVTAREVATTHCPAGHEYTPENTYRRPDNPNKRDCKICRRERQRDPNAKPQLGDNHSQTKLSDSAVRQLRELHASGVRQIDLVQASGLSQQQVSRILRGQSRQSAGGPIVPQRVRNGEISKDAWQAATRGKGKS